MDFKLDTYDCEVPAMTLGEWRRLQTANEGQPSAPGPIRMSVEAKNRSHLVEEVGVDMGTAACIGADVRFFFHPDNTNKKGENILNAEAKKICDTCPVVVKDQCLENALSKSEQNGFQGGMTATARKKLKKERSAFSPH